MTNFIGNTSQIDTYCRGERVKILANENLVSMMTDQSQACKMITRSPLTGLIQQKHKN